ncbi:hypothetical protein [Streptomyces sp. NRRL F-2664]|uniref:dioxygenase family protein n=1 Tax=Streptomyces sp. NRRL F-2664 TaxID=1463842 RepID=UPI000996D97B|nr:hypothetical protein [Streptomyces sp. NRRL F-2664]
MNDNTTTTPTGTTHPAEPPTEPPTEPDATSRTGPDAKPLTGPVPGRASGSPAAGRRALLLAAGSAAATALLATACTTPATRTTAARPTPSPTPVPTRSRRATAAAPTCVLAVTAGAGPYYLDLDLVRSDITQGREGAPLRLDLTVVRATDNCRPVPDARVELWHADADGQYSTGTDTFLRGTQITDPTGHCVFHTIVPGWYAGLAPHIHVKIRPTPHTETTSQFFFPEDHLTSIYTRHPYARRTPPAHPNTRDPRYHKAATTMTLPLTPHPTGYHTTYTIGIT